MSFSLKILVWQKHSSLYLKFRKRNFRFTFTKFNKCIDPYVFSDYNLWGFEQASWKVTNISHRELTNYIVLNLDKCLFQLYQVDYIFPRFMNTCQGGDYAAIYILCLICMIYHGRKLCKTHLGLCKAINCLNLTYMLLFIK